MYLFQHIMYQRASCFLVIDTQVSTQHWVGRKKLRMVSPKMCSCVGVEDLKPVQVWGSSLTSKQLASLDFQSNRLLGHTDAGTTDSAAQFQVNDICELFCYFPLFPWSTWTLLHLPFLYVFQSLEPPAPPSLFPPFSSLLT